MKGMFLDGDSGIRRKNLIGHRALTSLLYLDGRASELVIGRS